MTFKILQHFICNEGVLREILFLNENETEKNINQWQWLAFGYEKITLQYNYQNDNVKFFDKATLKNIDYNTITFIHNNKNYILNRTK